MPEDDLFVTTRIDIAAPPTAVWLVLTAFSRYAAWHPTMSIDGAAPELELGARLAFRLSGGAAGDQAFIAEVTEVAAPSLLAWQGGAEGVFFGRHTFELQALSGDSTRFIDTERWSGSMAASVLAGHRVTLEKEYARTAAALKEEAERGYSAAR